MKKNTITSDENSILDELEQVNYEGLPLIRLIIKNCIYRELHDDQITTLLNDLVQEGKVPPFKSKALSVQSWAKMIIKHFERKKSAVAAL